MFTSVSVRVTTLDVFEEPTWGAVGAVWRRDADRFRDFLCLHAAFDVANAHPRILGNVGLRQQARVRVHACLDHCIEPEIWVPVDGQLQAVQE